jgi:hypothetical protein
MARKDESKTTDRLKEYLKESNLKDEKKFSQLDNLDFYLDFTASEAAVITKVRTLLMLPKQQYYPSYIKEFQDNEFTQFICDLVKYGNEKISWDKITHANEEGRKYREKEIERRKRSKLKALQQQRASLEEEEKKIAKELGLFEG